MAAVLVLYIEVVTCFNLSSSVPADPKRSGLETRNKDQDIYTHAQYNMVMLTHVHRVIYQQTTLSAVSALSCMLRGTPHFQTCQSMPTQLHVLQFMFTVN